MRKIFKNKMWFMALLALLVAVTLTLTGCGGGGSGVPFTPSPVGLESSGSGAGGLGKGPKPVNLGQAGSFVILSKSGITDADNALTHITGNIGSSPITAAAMNDVFCSSMTGFIYGADAAYVGSGDVSCFKGLAADITLVGNAVLDMGTAYTDAAGRPADFTELGAGNIGGMTLPPGTYKWGTGVIIPTDVTLKGGPNDVWIFEIAQDLVISSGKQIKLSGGARPQNVFWQVFGIVDVGTTAHFQGIALVQTQFTLKTGASVNGRVLAQTAVVLDANAVTQP